MLIWEISVVSDESISVAEISVKYVNNLEE